MNQHNVPGASFAIVKDGRLVLAAGYEYADLARTQPVQPESLFRVASVSKPITAVAVMKAVDDGLLDLDTPVAELISDLLPKDGLGDQRFRRITTRHLLSHTSGLQEELLLQTKEVARKMKTDNPHPADAIVSYAMRLTLGSDPGEQYHYSNTGYVIVGRVLEAVTGMPYEAYVRDTVLKPIGVTRARIGGPRRSDRLAGEVEYDARGNKDGSIFSGQWRANAAYGGLHLKGFDISSGWVASAIDLARFSAAADGKPSIKEILSPEAFAVMLKQSTPPEQQPYGLGWNVRAIGEGPNALKNWDHTGSMGGTSAYLGVFEDGSIYVGLLNTFSFEGPAMFNDFIAAFIEGVQAVDAIDWPEHDLFLAFQKPQLIKKIALTIQKE